MFLLILVGAFIIWFMFRADGDVTLLFKERFGTRVENLKEKVIWITGASSGIGKELAYILASVKAKLILSGTNEERLRKVQQKCLDVYGMKKENIMVLPFNISDFNVHEEKFKAVLNRFGKLDILVNNAAKGLIAVFENIEMKVDKELFDINVFGPINLTRVVLPHFLENNKGHFVVTSSTAGMLGLLFGSTYAGTKYALHGYFESLRQERIKYGISVTICCPGLVTTPMYKNSSTGTFGEVFAGPTQNDDLPNLPSKRCAQLMAVAIANKLDHAWITKQPILLLHYLAQYTPTIFRNWIISAVPKSYLEKIKTKYVH